MKTVKLRVLQDYDFPCKHENGKETIEHWKKGQIVEVTKKYHEQYIKGGLCEYAEENKTATKKDHTPKDILDRYATTIIRKNRVFLKDGSAQVDSSKPDNYTPDTYSEDLVLWHAPKSWIRLEFEAEPDKNRRIIAECESACKGYEIQYCITEHEDAKSPYLNICNIKGLPLNMDNKLYKEALIDYILPSSAKEQLDKTNYQWTLSPVIGHPHWKPKYKGAIHQIVRGIHPLDQVNEYPKELKTKIDRLKKAVKSTTMQLLQNNQWVNDFLLNYCTTHTLPKGSRHRVIEKNLAIFIFHRSDRDDILNKYLQAQGRTTDTLRTWTNAIIRGEYKEVSPGELNRWIQENNVDYIIPKRTDATTTAPTEEPITDDELNELKDPNLLLNIVGEVQKGGLIGNESTILTIASKVATNYLCDVEPTSKTLNLTDDPDGGKDKTVMDTLKVMKTVHEYANDVSEKAISYWTEKNWDHEVFYLEDPPEETIQSSGFKAWITGKGKFLTLIDQKPVWNKINGQPVIIMTSYLNEVTLEGDRRIDFKNVENTSEVTLAFKKDWLDKKSGEKKEKPKSNEALISALNYRLKDYHVVIPAFKESEIREKFIDKIISGKSNLKRYTDYISAITVLHQYQRDKDENGNLIATFFDVIVGSYLYQQTRGKIGKSLSMHERKLISFLHGMSGPVEFLTVEAGLGMAYNTIHNKVQGWLDKEIVEITSIPKECGYATRDVAALSLHPQIKKTYDPMILNDFNMILNDFFKIIDYHSNSSNNIKYVHDFNDFNKIMKTINERRSVFGLTSIFNVSSRSFPAVLLKSLESCTKTPQITPVGHDSKNGFSNHLKSVRIMKPKKPDASMSKDVNAHNIKDINKHREPSQQERIAEIKKYCEGKDFVSIAALNDNFSPTDIYHLIESRLLVKAPSEPGFENYRWSG